MGIPLQTIEYKDNSGGLNLKASPTKVPEDESSRCLNVDYSTDGAVSTRRGSRIQNVDVNGLPQQMDQLVTLGLFDYQKSDGTSTQVIAAGTRIKHSLTNPISQSNFSTGLSIVLDASLPIPDMEFMTTLDNEHLFYGNGIDTNLKYNGSVWTNLSLPIPASPILSLVAGGALPLGNYAYYYSFVRFSGGTDIGGGIFVDAIIDQEGQLNPDPTIAGAANITTTVGNQQIQVLRSAPADNQVNGWVVYRRSPTSVGLFTRLIDATTQKPIVIGIANVAYLDNNATDGTILANFDNDAAPTSAILEEYLGRMYYVPASDKSTVLFSKVDRPWNVPITNELIFDGEVRCIKRFYGALIIGTDRSLWVLNGDPNQNSPRRISSIIGIWNNRCAVGESFLYILGTNKRIYPINPTDFSQNEVRIDDAISINIEPLIRQVGNAPNGICMEYFTIADISKVYISVPLGTGQNTNNAVLVYNETQSILKKKANWVPWDNLNVSAIKQFKVNNDLGLYFGDYNGFLWSLEDSSIYGDGAIINGTATSGSPLTLGHIVATGTATSGGVDTLTNTAENFTVNSLVQKTITITAGTGAGQVRTILSNTSTVIKVTVAWGVVPDNTSVYLIGAFVPNALQGLRVRITDGVGANQVRTITTNTSTTLSIDSTWAINPTAGSEYTIGGYVVEHFSNFKAALNSYDFLKQLWFIWINANSSGNYSIKLVIQTEFNQSNVSSDTIFVNLNSLNAIWGYFIWGLAIWGAQAVFQDRFRNFQRFRSIRIGFTHNLAGQPFQINSFSLSVQNKGLFFKST